MGSMEEAFNEANSNEQSHIVQVQNFKDNHKKLTIDDQIIALKEKGINFKLASEKEARAILSDINYYHKITLFRRNFERVKLDTGEKYHNLDFSYLSKIASKDMQLRYLLLQMCLDIEHSLRTQLMGQIAEDEKEDGYEIVEKFIQSMADQGFEIDVNKIISIAKKNRHYQHNLYIKNNDKDMMPIWVLIEFMSFSNTVDLFLFYHKTKKWTNIKNNVLKSVLFSVKNIRNTCAHSSPILFELCDNSLEHQSNEIGEFASESNIRRTLRKYMKFNDVICLFYLYDILVKGQGSKLHRYNMVKDFYHRCQKDLSYLSEDNPISLYLDTIKKLLDRNIMLMDNDN